MKKVEEKEFPTVTTEHLKSIIKLDHYHTFERNTLTICVLELKNGFSVTGESACACPENFDQAKGQKFAFEDAFEKLWALEGYLLKQKLYEFHLGLENDIGM